MGLLNTTTTHLRPILVRPERLAGIPCRNTGSAKFRREDGFCNSVFAESLQCSLFYHSKLLVYNWEFVKDDQLNMHYNIIVTGGGALTYGSDGYVRPRLPK